MRMLTAKPVPVRGRPTIAATLFCLLLTLSLAAPAFASPPDQPHPATVDFLRDVRPILSGHCFKCHGPDEAARKARLRLDTPEGAIQPARSGYPAIVPHDPEESELVRRVLTEEPTELMPPPAAKLPLSEVPERNPAPMGPTRRRLPTALGFCQTDPASRARPSPAQPGP